MACREDQQYLVQLEGASYLWPNQAIASQAESGSEKAVLVAAGCLLGFGSACRSVRGSIKAAPCFG